MRQPVPWPGQQRSPEHPPLPPPPLLGLLRLDQQLQSGSVQHLLPSSCLVVPLLQLLLLPLLQLLLLPLLQLSVLCLLLLLQLWVPLLSPLLLSPQRKAA